MNRQPSLLLALTALLLAGCAPKAQPAPAPSSAEESAEAVSYRADFGAHGSAELIGFVKPSNEGPRGTDPAGNLIEGAGDSRMLQAINDFHLLSPAPELAAVFWVEEKNSTIGVAANREAKGEWYQGKILMHVLRGPELPAQVEYTVTATWQANDVPAARYRLRGSEIESLTPTSPCEITYQSLTGNLSQLVADCVVPDIKETDSLTFALVGPNGDQSDGVTVSGKEGAEGKPIRLILPLSPNAIGEAVVLRTQTETISLKVPVAAVAAKTGEAK